MPAMDKPRKRLPRWVEPVIVLFMCVTAVVEYNRGETFWAFFFAAAALYFSVTALLRRK